LAAGQYLVDNEIRPIVEIRCCALTTEAIGCIDEILTLQLQEMDELPIGIPLIFTYEMQAKCQSKRVDAMNTIIYHRV
jgi:hypothetical protein